MTTARWNRSRVLALAVVLALAAAAGVSASPTPAGASGHELCVEADSPGATLPQATILEVCAEYDQTELAFAMRVAAPTDPETDPGWAGDTQIAWVFNSFAETSGLPTGQLSVHTVEGDLRVVATVFDHTTPACEGEFSLDGQWYRASFDPRCLDLPAAITFAGYIQYDINPGAPQDGPPLHSDRLPQGDTVDGQGAFAGPVSSDGWSCPHITNADLESAPFDDRLEIPAAHRLNVDCATAHGIVTGHADNTYRPTLPVRRDQMAAFVFRALEAGGVELPPAGDGFTDVPAGSAHNEAVRRLAAAGIVRGGPGHLPAEAYGPALPVRRDQMASFLLRAAEYAADAELASDQQAFSDVPPGNAHFANVNGAAEHGLAAGYADNTYRPAASVRRDQTATFAVRMLGSLDGEVEVSVFFSGPDSDQTGEVFPLPRTVTAPGVLRGAMDALLEGPTAAERAEDYWSWFSEDTVGMVRSVYVTDRTAYVDFDDFSEIIPNASTSAGSLVLLSQLDATATQFPTVDQARYSFEGDQAAFYNWLQMAVPTH